MKMIVTTLKIYMRSIHYHQLVRSLKILTIPLICLSIVACSSQPKISDVNNYLLIKEYSLKYNNFRDTLLVNKDNLLTTTSVYQKDLEKPTSRFNDLNQYLIKNDCTKKASFKDCYYKTRLKLIETTDSLSNTEYKVYLLNNNITTLKGSLEKVIDGLPEMNIK